MSGSKGKPWVSSEIKAIIVDYMDMLQIELTGGTIVKAAHNRALQKLIDRSLGSIEYKHQNISAVMAAFGLPFIRGYLPAVNYQQALFEAIKEHLVGNKLHEHLANAKVDITVPPSSLVYGPAPMMNDALKTDNPVIRRILQEFDPAARDAKARSLGEAGEDFLFQAEQDRLSAKGRDDLAAKVRWVAKEDGDGAGFDILSFSKRGKERWLEVKTTNGPSTTPFWISENERRVSVEHRNIFRLVRLYDFSRQPAAYRLIPPLADHVRLIPTQYRATF